MSLLGDWGKGGSYVKWLIFGWLHSYLLEISWPDLGYRSEMGTYVSYDCAM